MNQVASDFRVQIDVAKNGYIVRPASDMQRDIYMPISEFQVFESFEALVAHLRARLPIYPVFTGVLTVSTPPKKRVRA